MLITGANGHLGSQTIDFLLEDNPNEKIAGLVRSKEKGKELGEKRVDIALCLILLNEFKNRSTSSTERTTGILDGFFIPMLKSKSMFSRSTSSYKNLSEATICFMLE